MITLVVGVTAETRLRNALRLTQALTAITWRLNGARSFAGTEVDYLKYNNCNNDSIDRLYLLGKARVQHKKLTLTLNNTA
jgi:hypothetical protein